MKIDRHFVHNLTRSIGALLVALGTLSLSSVVLATSAPPAVAGAIALDPPLSLGWPFGAIGSAVDHIQIFNLFLSNNWNEDTTTPTPGTATLDDFTAALASSNYLDQLQQYGFRSARFAGAAGNVTGRCSIPASPVSFTSITSWVNCEAANLYGNLHTPSGTKTLWVVYAPPSVKFSDPIFGQDCSPPDDWNGFHAQTLPTTSLANFLNNWMFAYISTRCPSSTGLDAITEAAAHEVVESITDPGGVEWVDRQAVPGIGQVENAVLHDIVTFNLNAFKIDIQKLFADLQSTYAVGEAADMCENIPGAPAPSTVVPTIAGGTFDVVEYWSNEAHECVPVPIQSPPTTQDLTQIQFTITTGAADLGGGQNGSGAQAVVFANGGQFTVTLKTTNSPDWPNNSVNTETFQVPSWVLPPLTTANPISGVEIQQVQNNPGWSANNWDIDDLAVSLSFPGGPQVCQLDLTGSNQLQDGSTGLVRLSLTPGGSGNGPDSPEFFTGPTSGCP
jgi:hypothetical protein